MSKGGKPLPKEQWQVYLHTQDFIDIGAFNKAQQYLKSKRNKYYAQQTDNRTYLLQGLLKCANCYNPTINPEPYSWHGSPHIVKSTGKKAYYYGCSSKNVRKKNSRSVECHTIPLPAKPLEKNVIEFIKTLLDNPSVVFKYQQKLQSKKNDIRVKRSRCNTVKNLINKHNVTKEHILNLYKDGHYNSKRRDEELSKEENSLLRFKRELTNLESELSLYTNTEEYYKVFEAFREDYDQAIDVYKDTANTDQLYNLIHMMIEEIIIFSRPKTRI
jgi:hypothetical protein